jgi:hypothetical protein
MPILKSKYRMMSLCQMPKATKREKESKRKHQIRKKSNSKQKRASQVDLKVMRKHLK